jgi:hypothetical protein
MRRLFTTGVALLLLGSAAASDVCEQVQWLPQERLEMGTVRAQPGATGFMELDPREGLSMSNSGATHQGPSGPGVTIVQGPIGAAFRVGIEAAPVSTTRALTLVELIVRVGSEQHRMPLSDATLLIQLPNSGNEAGIAQMRIQVGAVFRYAHSERPQAANYRLTFRCEPPELP